MNEILKSVVAQFNAAELVMQREEVSRRIRERLTERAKVRKLIFSEDGSFAIAFGMVEKKNAIDYHYIIHLPGFQHSPGRRIHHAFELLGGIRKGSRIQTGRDAARGEGEVGVAGKNVEGVGAFGHSKIFIQNFESVPTIGKKRCDVVGLG